MPGVGVDSHEASDRAFDAGRLPGFADRRLGDGLAEVDSAAGHRPVVLSVRRISRLSPALLITTTLTDGTRLLAFGALPLGSGQVA